MNTTQNHTTAPDAPDAPAAQRHDAAHTHAIRKWLTVLTVLMLGSWVVFGIFLFRHGASNAAHSNPYNGPGGPAAAGPGPWGQLEYTPIIIAPPLEYVSEISLDFSGAPEWHFPNIYLNGLSALCEEIGLSRPLGAKLVSMAKPAKSFRGLSIHPPKQFVMDLSGKDRSALYAVLCQYPQNFDQRNQFAFRGASPDEWFAGSMVSAATRKIVEPLIYRRGEFMYFADLRIILDSIAPKKELHHLLKTLRREATFLIHLKVSDKSDIEALVNYWGRSGRVQEVRPIIESMARSGGDKAINITYLLPPLARRRLYTYPAGGDT